MRPALIILGLGLGSCVSSATRTGPATAGELAGRIAGPPQSCVAGNSVSTLRAAGQGIVLLGSGPTIYANRLRAPCRLTAMSTIVVERYGPQYCSGDRVRVFEAGSTLPGPVCALGDWIPYTRP